MNAAEEKFKWLNSNPGYVSMSHEGDKIITFERNLLLFVFNFHYDRSFTDYRVGVEFPGNYKIILSTDDTEFGGFGRVDTTQIHSTLNEGHAGRNFFIHTYLPSRTGFVFARVDSK